MIEFHDVSHRFGDRRVLDSVTLRLPERRVAVIGANGSGKSTLARMINGLIIPERGRVLVNGLDPSRQGAAVRRRVGFVFTDPDSQILMPTPAEDVAFSLRRAGLDPVTLRRRVEEILDRFGLLAHRDHPAQKLSGGQKQLLALAAVLATEPDVLVCDEPTTLLDLRNKRRIVELLHTLPQQVVLVTHDLGLLDGFDRVVVLDDGRVVGDGPPAEAVAHYERVLAR